MAVTSSPRLGLTRWSSADDPFSRGQIDGDNADLDTLVAIDLQVTTINNRPAAAIRGRFCTVDDGSTAPRTYRDTGTRWVEVNLPTYGGTPVAETFAAAGAAGTSTALARADHVHAMPANPLTAHLAATDPHPQYLTTSDTGWLAAGFAAQATFTQSVSNYKVRNGHVTMHLRFTKTSGASIVAGSNGNVSDVAALTIPTPARSNYKVAGAGALNIGSTTGASCGFIYYIENGVLTITASTNPNVTWTVGTSFYSTVAYDL